MSNLYVLGALKIFTYDEMLTIAQSNKSRAALKKAAGAELVVWEDDSASVDEAIVPEGKVLAFKRKDEGDGGEEVESADTELLFWQRNHAPRGGSKEVVKGYKKATETFMVKTKDVEGKEKISFAATHGVLINKKQA
jgi:hypothetical protein